MNCSPRAWTDARPVARSRTRCDSSSRLGNNPKICPPAARRRSAEAEVLERSGSEGVEPGELLFAKIVPVEGVALMEACAPVLIPPQEKIQLIELRKKMSAASALSATGMRENDVELRTVLLPMMDRLLYPRPPAVANTDGDPLEFHTLRFDLPDPTAAVAQFRDLAVGVEEEEFESGIERDAAGRVVRADISWLRAGDAGTAMENTVLGHIKVEAGRLSADEDHSRPRHRSGSKA